MEHPDDAETSVAMLLRRASAAGLGPGWVGLAVGENGEGLCWCEGVRAFGADAVEPSLWYDLASLTKPLVTGSLLLLARRDGLDLDAPVAELLPELRGSAWGSVTYRQCATHSAGFPAWEPLYVGGCSEQAYLERIVGVPPLAPPGRHVEYSCLGFVLLGFALARAAGTDLASLFHELVNEPLGLDDSLAYAPSCETEAAIGEVDWFVERRLLAERGIEATPPAGRPDALPCGDGNARGLGGAAGNAGLFGCAVGIAQLALEYLPGGGELITAEEAELATRCWTPGLEQARGLGWQLAPTPGCSAGPALPSQAFGHTGFSGTSVWVEPDSRSALVLLGNRLHRGGRIPDLAPLRRRFKSLALGALRRRGAGASMPTA
jgi:CubicO group peptidase (beta-lactamase class C family)